MIADHHLIHKCHVYLGGLNTTKTSCKALFLSEIIYPIAQEQSVWIINNCRSVQNQ